MMQGYLESIQVKVPRYRVRQSMRRVDPQGVENRKKKALKRREYHVAGPNALWHIDGNHKLIRYVYKCDLIKRNESDVGHIGFEILAKTVFKFLCFILFLALTN